MSKLILISIKEKYVRKILSGRKTIELRKSVPKASPGDTLIIYTTQPKKAVTAIAFVKNILICTPEEMWLCHKEYLGIDKVSFDEYYKNHRKAVGIEISEVFQLDAEILLSAIKLIHPRFSPPQTFKYLNKFTTLRDFKNLNI
ncbi:ASCH domain-containing protein [Mucilaginibacter sp. SMC90]|uniref:ASCH domain-containing protein n=1 Tax=Mucilaginibacter sp. SMC90 TaxID=2929803 RepID=UPI001FB41BAA|nr:ASCH domain-containing protein [Mucilaginibacter sp. SMC90]UOE49816.1 ASCH domain-containing protein [Mucilaginibacter sp. SMC90]